MDIPAIVRQVVKEIGYDDPKCGFDNTCGVLTSIDTQSPDIAMGVNQSLEAKNGETDENSLTGAGDQGMMFSYACDETPEKMPLAISHHPTSWQSVLAQVRKDSTELSPSRQQDPGHCGYDGDTVKRVDFAIVVSTQHDEDVKLEKLKKDIIKYVIKPVVPAELVDQNTRIYINPTGRFVIGGPVGDNGLTGRKIIVDTCSRLRPS